LIHFRLDPRAGTPPYAQLVQQVRRAIIQGVLAPGDQLPTAREVVSALAINPNTVLKAYTVLESEGFVQSRPGLGTFVAETAPAPVAEKLRRRLRPDLDAWLTKARRAGLDEEAVFAIFASAVDDAYGSGVA
jgi:DNA-binding transcriptional regulator YhcF (GntR family)